MRIKLFFYNLYKRKKKKKKRKEKKLACQNKQSLFCKENLQ